MASPVAGQLRLVETWGSNSDAYSNDRLGQLGSYFAGDHAADSVSAALAFVRGAKAKDPVQSSLAVQMTATHDAAMKALRKVDKAEWVEQAQVFGNLACKLLNAYTRQAETLAKLQQCHRLGDTTKHSLASFIGGNLPGEKRHKSVLDRLLRQLKVIRQRGNMSFDLLAPVRLGENLLSTLKHCWIR
jgi:hypothetical protein